MKICYLADINSVHTQKWIKFFKEKEYEIHVISLQDGEYEGVKVHSLKVEESVMKGTNNRSKLKYLKTIDKVKELVREIKPDILHAHYATSYGLLGAVTKFHPYIISVWGSDVYDFPIKSIIHKNLLKYNLKKADYILSTSNIMKSEIEKYTSKDITVTPFGVNISKFIPNKSIKKEIVIGTIKSLEAKYGIEYLVKAFKIVKDNNSNLDIKLRIGGSGSQLEYLKNLCEELGIESFVTFLGQINQEAVIKEFQNFDVAVFPSILDSESFGVAAVEAEACGIPVVVTDVGGLMESTKPNATSLVCKRASAEALAEKIDILVKDNELRKEMGIEARKFIEENYNLEDNFNDVRKLYKKITNK